MRDTALTALGGGSGVAFAIAGRLSGAPAFVLVLAVLTPVILLGVHWAAVLLGRELFARKAPTVRRDLLELVELEKAQARGTAAARKPRRTGPARGRT